MMDRAFRGRALVRAAILIPWAIPTAVTTKLWYVIFDPQGILNRILGTQSCGSSSQWPARSAVVIADIWKTTPFIALLILAGLQGIPAMRSTRRPQIDGANAWQRFTQDHPAAGEAGPGWSRSSSVRWTRCACTTCRRS